MAKKKVAKTAVKFSQERAVAFHKQGNTVSQIAQAFGYQPGKGNNRVRRALVSAGVYKTTTRAATPAPTKKIAPKRVLALGVPEDADTALKVCLRTIEVNVDKLKLDDKARNVFARKLMGSIATNFGVMDFQVRKPVFVLDIDRARPAVLQAMAQA